jgi:pyrroline-5-carboxylate reductase
MKLGFIGAGNMGSAIFKGFIAKGKVDCKDIYITRRNKAELASQASELGVNACEDGCEIVRKCDVVFLAVKPIMFGEVLGKIRAEVKAEKPLIVSMAAGISTEDIETMLDVKGVRVVRIMPNVNAQVAMSVTAVCAGSNASNEDVELVNELFNSIGETAEVEEKHFAIFTAIAGCSPAYVYMFINSLAEGALKAGMNKKLAIRIAAGAVMGSAKLVLESGKHPEELNDMVCSPGGTTIEGVCTLKEKGFEAAVISAVENSILKDAALKKN